MGGDRADAGEPAQERQRRAAVRHQAQLPKSQTQLANGDELDIEVATGQFGEASPKVWSKKRSTHKDWQRGERVTLTVRSHRLGEMRL